MSYRSNTLFIGGVATALRSLVGGVVVATALRSLWSSRCCGSGSSRCAATFSTTSVRCNRCSRGRTSTTVKDQITQQSCAA